MSVVWVLLVGVSLLGHLMRSGSLGGCLLVLTDLVVIVRDFVDVEGLTLLGRHTSHLVMWAWAIREDSWLG